MTDIKKYKSVIVRVETHRKLKEIAGEDRKISGILSQLVEKEHNSFTRTRRKNNELG